MFQDVEYELPYSPHPEDSYLKLVLHKSNHKEEWSTHLYNASDGGFHSGHYFQTKNAAVRDLILRAALNFDLKITL